ncbi:hypothetical protein IJ670_00305 [bacterium]|nr:hypothetical protein [bacterium]
MKRIAITIYVLLCLFLGIQSTFATDYSKISTNAKIVSALNKLEGINRRDVISILNGNNATKMPIRVMFRDLAVYGHQDCEALTVPTRNGGLVIYINSEHKSASPECIACLLAHESQHHTFTNSRQEELRAWISETQAWNELVKKDRTLLTSTEPLAKRENYIANIRNNKGVTGIEKIIASNPVYSKLN